MSARPTLVQRAESSVCLSISSNWNRKIQAREYIKRPFLYFFFFFKIYFYFIDYAVTVVPCFSALYPPPSCTSPPSSIPPTLSSHPCVIHINSLASPFLILFLTSPCWFCTYQLCFLFPVPFVPLSSLPLPDDNPPSDLHFSDSVPVLVDCLVSLFVD